MPRPKRSDVEQLFFVQPPDLGYKSAMASEHKRSRWRSVRVTGVALTPLFAYVVLYISLVKPMPGVLTDGHNEIFYRTARYQIPFDIQLVEDHQWGGSDSWVYEYTDWFLVDGYAESFFRPLKW